MVTIIAGSRSGAILADVEKAVAACGWTPTVVVSGCASGVDTLGEQWALRNKVEVKRFPAKWKQFGRYAGFLRNKEMADNAEALIAVWDGKSRGTKNMIEVAQKKGLTVFVYRIL